MAKTKVSIALHPELLAEVDWLAHELDLTRTEMISWALCYVLNAKADSKEEQDQLDVINHQFGQGRIRDLLEARAMQLHDEEMARRFGGPDE